MSAPLARALNQYIDAHGGGEGLLATPVAGLALFRATDTVLPSHSLYRPCLCVVAQGAKQVSFGKEALTSMTPLQYQKQLRLLEARRLMLAEGANVSRAACQVGYESASQFSRGYSRMFGAAPKRDAIEHKGVRA